MCCTPSILITRRGQVRTPYGINVLVGICRPSLRSPYSVTATIPEAAEQDQEQHRLPADRGEGPGNILTDYVSG